MRRKGFAALVAGASVAVGLLVASPAGAFPVEPPQIGGCPSGGGWFLAPVGAAIPDLDNGNSADQNGDGWGCARVNKGQTAKHSGISSWTWKDNTNGLTTPPQP